jgi:hypothetical protein
MKKLDLNELPKHTPWVARLLGLEAFEQKHRDIDQIEREYNGDKFKKCLDLYEESGGAMTSFDLRIAIDRIGLDDAADAVRDGDIVLASLREINDRRNEILVDALRPAADRGDTIVELGSAFGFNLDHLAEQLRAKRFVGADYSENAIALARKLFKDDERFHFDTFNFYDEAYSVLAGIPGSFTVLTAQAIEQMPTAAPLIAALGKERDRVSEVIQLEPNHSSHDATTLLGAMRARYGDLNDYNRDLIPLVEDSDDIEVLEKSVAVIGFNAFNPLTLLRWRFR